jgi:hypothetical protein
MNAREWPPIGCGSEDNPLTNSVYSVGNYDAGGGSPLPPGSNGLLMTTGDFVLLTGGGVFLLAE